MDTVAGGQVYSMSIFGYVVGFVLDKVALGQGFVVDKVALGEGFVVDKVSLGQGFVVF
jgi:hypothetical protein